MEQTDKAKTRRTQAERRATTRQALLDATVELIIEIGYAATTTTLVSKRAGVSQGALFNHFETKSALVAAATEQLFERLITDFRDAFVDMPEGDERVVWAVRKLWEVFQAPELRAAYALYTAAAADAELAKAIRPVVERHNRNVDDIAATLFPEIAESPELFALLDIVVFSMQGVMFESAAYANPERQQRMLAQLENLGRLAIAIAPKKSQHSG
ncbi:MAG: TetR/AcrR family transcriptional regulator [Polyangiaceae bacterium]